VHGYVAFLVDGDGKPTEVRAAAVPQDALLEACMREVVAEWEFPALPGTLVGPQVVEYAYEAGLSELPQYPGPGGLRASLRDPRCVDDRLRLPPEYRSSSGVVIVKVAVDTSGAPALVHAVTFAPDAVLEAVRRAVALCAWTPGAGPDARIAPLWVTLPVRLSR
jgi:hypothetical protein